MVYKSDGALYLTDPPFGLPKFFDDPRKELPFSGVYRVKDGELTLLIKDLTGPNGIAFSPDEKYLYVGNWDDKLKVVMRYPVLADGTGERPKPNLQGDGWRQLLRADASLRADETLALEDVDRRTHRHARHSEIGGKRAF